MPSGSVRVGLDRRGRVIRAETEARVGHGCGDELILKLTRMLWYHWLPSERYPAPVELIQPVALIEARG